jgi:hypothetical protein
MGELPSSSGTQHVFKAFAGPFRAIQDGSGSTITERAERESTTTTRAFLARGVLVRDHAA